MLCVVFKNNIDEYHMYVNVEKQGNSNIVMSFLLGSSIVQQNQLRFSEFTQEHFHVTEGTQIKQLNQRMTTWTTQDRILQRSEESWASANKISFCDQLELKKATHILSLVAHPDGML